MSWAGSESDNTAPTAARLRLAAVGQPIVRYPNSRHSRDEGVGRVENLYMTPSSQVMESPAMPGRFKPLSRRVLSRWEEANQEG